MTSLNNGPQLNRMAQTLVSALILTNLLTLSGGWMLTPGAIAQPQPATAIAQAMRPAQPTGLPRSLANRVRRLHARTYRLPLGQVRVVQATRATFPDRCLGIPNPDELCAQAVTDGWRVTVTDGGQTQIYRTDTQGQVIRQERQQPSTANPMPPDVTNAVLQAHARMTRIPQEQLRIQQATRETFPDGCLGLANAGEFCTQALVEGWRVTVSDGCQTWIYRTDSAGQVIRPERSPTQDLPAMVQTAVLRAAASQFNIPVAQLSIAAAEPRTWNGCLGIDPGPGGACTEIAVSGWQVTVVSRNPRGNQRDSQQFVYHTNSNGSDVRFNAAASQVER